jgi:glycosyltransferase involved in cell wall biosynthesis
MHISVIIPVFNEEGSVKELYNKLTNVLSKIKSEYEIVFIDDGSTDETLKRIIDLKKSDEHIKVLSFVRNFGKSSALMAGFDKASGDIIITLDGDLQDDPMEIPRFIEKLKGNYDLINGWKFVRQDPLNKTLPSKFFNKLTSFVTGVKLHDFNCGYKGYKKSVVKKLKLYKGFHRYIPAIAQWQGCHIGEMKVKHHPRMHGVSKYKTERLFKGLIDLILLKRIYSKNNKNSQVIWPSAFLITLVGFLIGIFSGINNDFYELLENGYAALPLSIGMVILGMQLFSIEILIRNSIFKKKNSLKYKIKKI